MIYRVNLMILHLILSLFLSTDMPESRILKEYMDTACYQVYQEQEYVRSFSDYKEAVTYSKSMENMSVVYYGVVWLNSEEIENRKIELVESSSKLNLPPFKVYQNLSLLAEIPDFRSACAFADTHPNSFVIGKIVLWDNYSPYYYEKDGERIGCYSMEEYMSQMRASSTSSALRRTNDDTVVYQKLNQINHKITGVPCIAQNPQLPRGCEVTSLAMLLNYHGAAVTKTELAENIEKISYKEDPNKGFIGDMYSLRTFGLGVYHAPIARLAEKYTNNKVLDLSGCDFEELYYFISNDMPVWVINNSFFSKLAENEFVYWNTPSGKIKITYREHSVLVTGIDENYVYFNDPLTGGARKVNKANFIAGWEQMGRQCVVIDPR